MEPKQPAEKQSEEEEVEKVVLKVRFRGIVHVKPEVPDSPASPDPEPIVREIPASSNQEPSIPDSPASPDGGNLVTLKQRPAAPTWPPCANVVSVARASLNQQVHPP